MYNPPGELKAAQPDATSVRRDENSFAPKEKSGSVDELASELMASIDKAAGTLAVKVRDNPLLAVAGVTAIGAIAAMAIMSRRSRTSQWDSKAVSRYARQAERKLRQELNGQRMQGAADSVASLITSSETLMKPLVQRFEDVVKGVRNQIG